MQSFNRAMPYSPSDRSTHWCAQTSNLARSAGVLQWVGRRIEPNWMSQVASLAVTSTGKLVRSMRSFSCQSTVVTKSTRRLPANTTTSWRTTESP